MVTPTRSTTGSSSVNYSISAAASQNDRNDHVMSLNKHMNLKNTVSDVLRIHSCSHIQAKNKTTHDRKRKEDLNTKFVIWWTLNAFSCVQG